MWTAVRRRLWSVGVLVAVVLSAQLAAAGPTGALHGKPRSPGISPSARAALLQAATAIAARHGDSRPHDVEAVRTTHRRAERILCGDCEFKLVPPGATVYAVAMRGHFNCNACSHPRWAHFAPASVITLQFLDPNNLGNVSFAYGGPYPDLDAAGTPVPL
jgi:hypothetical protein